jgi:hypothetical protein
MNPVEQFRLLQEIPGFDELLDKKLEEAMPGYIARKDELSSSHEPIEGSWEQILREQ